MAELAGFDEFYAASYRRVVGQVFALLGDLQEAEDVTQDAFAKASFHWARIAAYDQPEAWVRRVAFNQAYNSARRARRWLVALARHGPPPDAPAASADHLDLHRALGRLGPRHREVLVLHYIAELPLDEVARQLRLPLGTVKSRLSRARDALAEQVGDEREGVANA
ncbi:MAG TPA: sigma-70 family RNA polymerase sigma factor [Actinomycetota bacterium]|nr:sigma-70 family RNA polymerase sigma factor [Actinomycetota bacterium]